MSSLKWTGYLHVNGTSKAKRYENEDQLVEMRSSPFVENVIDTFLADNVLEANLIVKKHFKLLTEEKGKRIKLSFGG